MIIFYKNRISFEFSSSMQMVDDVPPIFVPPNLQFGSLEYQDL